MPLSRLCRVQRTLNVQVGPAGLCLVVLASGCSDDAVQSGEGSATEVSSNNAGSDLGTDPLCHFDPDDPHASATPPHSDELFNPTVLHRIELRVEPMHLGPLMEEARLENRAPRVPVSVTYDGVTVANAGIRLKGKSTHQALSGRASFSIKLNEFESDLRLEGMKKIVLNSTVHDPALVRAPASYDLTRALGIPSPRIGYALVTFNGEPYGLYNVVEPIGEQFLATHFGETNAWGNLYEASLFNIVGETDPEDQVVPIDLKDLDEGRCLDDLLTLQRSLADATDDDFSEQLDLGFDVDPLLRLLAVEKALGNVDGVVSGPNNFYLYHRPDIDRFVMLPWGPDSVLLTAAGDPWNLAEGETSLLARRIARSPALEARYRDAVDQTAELLDADLMLAELDKVGAWIHALEDPGPRILQDIARFDEEEPHLREVISQRAQRLAQGG